jgi:MFS family permease
MSTVEVAAPTTGAPRVATGVSGALVAMLALAMLVNYADRGSLSVAAPALIDQLHISSAQMGVLLSAFFWGYAAAHPLAGAIAQRFDVRWVMAIGLTLWAGATALCGFAASFAGLLALRLLVGLGESAIFPVNARILAEQAPDRQRGVANGIILVGQFAGPGVGTLLGGLILARFGWPWVFFALGGVSLLWLIPWLTLPLGLKPGGARAEPARPPTYAELLRQRGLWSVSLGQFCYAYTHYLLLTWLPLYLVKGLHCSLAEMGVIGAAVFSCQCVGSLASGWLSDLAIRRGMAAARARKLAMLISVAGMAVSTGLLGVLPPSATLPWLFAAGLSNGAASPLVFTIGQTLAGPTAGGRWMGIQNTCGQFAGMGAPIVTGVLLERTGGFSATFLVACCLSTVGFLIWTFFVPRIAPIAWRTAVAT